MNNENKEQEIIKNLKKETQNIKLSAEEKSSLFTRIINSPTPSPYSPVRSGWRFTSFTSKTLVYAFASFLIIMLSGSTLAYASLNSIPGESLYAMKIKITEPVLETLAFTSEARAERKADKAIRRLDEAEKLAKKNELTGEKRVELEVRFKENTKDFENEVEKIKENKKERKEKIKIKFEASLDAHADILKNVSAEKREEKEEKSRKEKKEEKRDETKIKTENQKEESETKEIKEESEVDLLEAVVREKSKERKEERKNNEEEENRNKEPDILNNNLPLKTEIEIRNLAN